jgi:5-methylcytosine-specific restriction endonuclease McrA
LDIACARPQRTHSSNLQVLCSKCNRSKRHQGDTDFRIVVSKQFSYSRGPAAQADSHGCYRQRRNGSFVAANSLS